MPYLHPLSDGSLLIKIYVQPKASRNAIIGLHNDALKVRLTAAPVEGKANKAVIAFLAKCLNLPKSSLSIRSGLQNRNKQVLVLGCTEENARKLLFSKTQHAPQP